MDPAHIFAQGHEEIDVFAREINSFEMCRIHVHIVEETRSFVNSALHPDFSAGRHSFRCP
jgi:hypothetical protein